MRQIVNACLHMMLICGVSSLRAQEILSPETLKKAIALQEQMATLTEIGSNAYKEASKALNSSKNIERKLLWQQELDPEDDRLIQRNKITSDSLKEVQSECNAKAKAMEMEFCRVVLLSESGRQTLIQMLENPDVEAYYLAKYTDSIYVARRDLYRDMDPQIKLRQKESYRLIRSALQMLGSAIYKQSAFW